MNPYTPLPNDQFRKGDLTLVIERVFPEQVVFHFTRQGGPPFNHTTISRDLFDHKAQASFKDGATLWRDEKQIFPTPMTTQSGSHNLHARLSPSDSKRWTNCTASVAFQEANAHRIPPDESTYASEGTEAHDWATKVLTREITESEIPESFRDPVSTYTQHCLSLVPGAELTHLGDCLANAEIGFDPPSHALFVEEQIPLFYQPEQTGTADLIALSPDRIYVRDYKHGAGVLVSTQENTQLAIYAHSVITHLSTAYQFPDDMEVDIAIVQPRHREAEGVTPWVITVGDLRTFCEEIEYRAIQARTAAERVRERIGSPGRDVSNDEIKEAAPGSVFAPSEGDDGACRWCKCKAFCATRLAAATEGMETPTLDAAELLSVMPELGKDGTPEGRIAAVSEITDSRGRIITDEYLVNLVGRAKAIRAFLSDAEEYLESRLLSGESIEGVKLVAGRAGNRTWSDIASADTFCKNQGIKAEDRYKFELKSPSQIEKLIKSKIESSPRTKNRFEQLVTRSSPRPTIALSSDKREAVTSAVQSMPSLDDFEV